MRADAECIFCMIVAGQVPCFKLFEEDDTFAFMDNYPANDGHCLVLAKEHYPTLFEVSDEAFGAVSHCVLRVARAVNQVLSPGFLCSRRWRLLCRPPLHYERCGRFKAWHGSCPQAPR